MGNPLTQAAVHISLDKTALPSSFTLKEGGFVFVRVLGKTPEGKTLVSFAGQRFAVETMSQAKVGETFKARIQIQNNRILLVPQKGSETIVTQSDRLSQLFASIGLPQDSVSEKMIQYMRQNNRTYTPAQLKKLRKLAERFSGKKSEAAETAMYLEDKGISATEEEISLLLDLFLKDGHKPLSPDDTEKSAENIPILDQLYSNPQGALQNKPGLLTLANHISKGEKHWLVFPFQKTLKNSQCSGTIRILCDIMNKKVEKTYITAFFDDCQYCFTFSDTDPYNEILTLEYAVRPTLSSLQKEKAEELLRNCITINNREINIEYRENILQDLFADSTEPIKTVDEEI